MNSTLKLTTSINPSPKGESTVNRTDNLWRIYRTRFLVKAKQLNEPLVFVDALGREHCGQKGDYLVESSDGLRRIAPRQIFEDVYVPLESAAEISTSLTSRGLQPSSPSRNSPRPALLA